MPLLLHEYFQKMTYTIWMSDSLFLYKGHGGLSSNGTEILRLPPCPRTRTVVETPLQSTFLDPFNGDRCSGLRGYPQVFVVVSCRYSNKYANMQCVVRHRSWTKRFLPMIQGFKSRFVYYQGWNIQQHIERWRSSVSAITIRLRQVGAEGRPQVRIGIRSLSKVHFSKSLSFFLSFFLYHVGVSCDLRWRAPSPTTPPPGALFSSKTCARRPKRAKRSRWSDGRSRLRRSLMIQWNSRGRKR